MNDIAASFQKRSMISLAQITDPRHLIVDHFDSADL